MSEVLASHRRCLDRITAQWPAFAAKRLDRLRQWERHGAAAEKVAENVLEDLFCEVLDWRLADIDYQVGYADLLLTRLGVKHLVVEVKRPGALAWHRRAVDAALEQARRYAAEQKVRCLAVSDGVMLYAADVDRGGLLDRVFVDIGGPEPPCDLWWISVHGIYRPRPAGDVTGPSLPSLPQSEPEPSRMDLQGALLHPKYHVPVQCFAYVGDASDPSTWKLPYLSADGGVDGRRLPKAIQSILTNYRGAIVGGIPEKAVPDVLVRLGQAAGRLGKMPDQTGSPAAAYVQLAQALEQFGRLEEVTQLSLGTEAST